MTYALQPLLRRTYEMEINCINEKKLECMKEMKEAREFVDKMRRNKLGLMNSLKLATGATAAGTDAVDAKVFSLKYGLSFWMRKEEEICIFRQRMEKIKASMDECHQRWIEVESLCGFSIAGSYGRFKDSSRFYILLLFVCFVMFFLLQTAMMRCFYFCVFFSVLS